MHIYVHIQINITVGREKSEAVKQVHYYHVPICRLLPPHWSFHTDTVHCEYIGRNPTLLCLKQWEEVPCNWASVSSSFLPSTESNSFHTQVYSTGIQQYLHMYLSAKVLITPLHHIRITLLLFAAQLAHSEGG